MRWILLVAGITLAAISRPALAEGERAGDFDYYVMSLSWSAAYCEIEGDEKGDDQCDPRHDHTFTLHGLWPQSEVGWPSYCRTGEHDPSRSETAAMGDIMGSGGLAWYQWRKHGRCSGLSAEDYFAAARQAYESIGIPTILREVRKDLKVHPSVIEEAFIEANPSLDPSMVTVTCDQGLIREVRICLTRDLHSRACGIDVSRDCRMPDATLEAVR